MRVLLTQSIRGRLIALTLSLLLPAVVAASVLLWRAYAQERDAAERQLLDTARALSLVVDRQIGQSAVLLQALATSPPLANSDWEGFDRQARAASPDASRWIAVVDQAGRQYVNTLLPAGNPLPIAPRGLDPRLSFTPLPHGLRLWNVTMGSLARRPVIVLAKTIALRNGRTMELAVITPASSFLDLLNQQRLPDRWTGTILDGRGHIVARSRSNDHYVGQSASAELIARLHTAPAVWPATTLDDIPAYLAVNRSPLTGWTMLIAMPRRELARGVWTSLVASAAIGLVLLGIGLLISYLVARSVALPMARLAGAAEAIGRGEQAAATRTSLREIVKVERALSEAGAARLSRERELQALNDSLEMRVVDRTRELAEATETLIQAQKMEAVGRLTGGIAHDFNNLLTAVIGNIEMLQRTAGDDRTNRLLANARHAAERGAKLTGQLLAFSRRQQLRAEVVDIDRAIDNTVELLRSTFSGAVTLVRVPSRRLWPAHADPTQLDLILLNLAINARDAMPTGGAIMIEAANRTVKEAGRTDTEPSPGDYVAITLSDNGTGMPPEVLARVFDPFFTTKPIGQGTGLGLPQVLGVLKQLGGGIRIGSRPGEGTSVTIFLRRAHAAAEAPDETQAGVTADLRGATVLLVDDDPDVRGVAAAMLRDAGCHVVEAMSGRAALDKLPQLGAVDAVLMDFSMPGLNGAETAQAMRAERPDLPILLMSGYADVEALSSIWTGPLLPKPFTAAPLLERLAAALTMREPSKAPAKP